MTTFDSAFVSSRIALYSRMADMRFAGGSRPQCPVLAYDVFRERVLDGTQAHFGEGWVGTPGKWLGALDVSFSSALALLTSSGRRYLANVAPSTPIDMMRPNLYEGEFARYTVLRGTKIGMPKPLDHFLIERPGYSLYIDPVLHLFPRQPEIDSYRWKVFDVGLDPEGTLFVFHD